MGTLLRVAFLFLCLALVAPFVRAADGYMATVTADPGKIMDGDKVVAEVPKGTRLWVFGEKERKAEVKVPDGEQHGWLVSSSVEKLKFSAAQEAENKQADELILQAIKQFNARDFAAARLGQEKALAIRQRLYGEHPIVADTFNTLALIEENLREISAAQKHHQAALAIRRKMLGNENPRTADTLSSLGNLARQQGNYPAARKYHEEALAIRRNVLGNEHPSTAGSLIGLGNVIRDQGDFPQVRKHYQDALAIYRKALGNENYEVANALNNLGAVSVDLGDYASSRKYYEEALEIKRKVLGNEHSSTADTLNNLGNTAREQGDYVAARKYLNDALVIYRKSLGNDHPSIANTLMNLGNLAGVRNDLTTARNYFEEALAIQRKVLGDAHPAVALTLSNLGNILTDQGDYSAAQKSYEEALAIKRKVLGNEHSSTSVTLANMGALANAQGNYPEALKFYDEALAIKRKVLGNMHPDTAQTLNNLGNLEIKRKAYSAARKYYDEALAIRSKVLGDAHPQTAESLNNLGILANSQGDYAAARKYSEQALAIYRMIYGNDHSLTAGTLNNLGYIARDEGQMTLAADFYDQNRRIIIHYVRRTLPSLSEAEQFKFLDNIYLQRWTEYLSFGLEQRNTKSIAEQAAAWLINGKAVAQESLAARTLLSRDAENSQLAPLVKELNSVRQQLAALSLATPKPSQAAKRQEQLAQLTSEEQRLERKIAQTSGQVSSERVWYGTDEIRAALPGEAIYVDLVRLSIHDYKLKKGTPPHYLAWIIPAKDKGDIQILDLGEAAPIEAACEKARGILAGANKQDGPLRIQGEQVAAKQLNADLQAVANLVLKPLLPHLKDKQQLILSPDGALWLLPWAALPVGENKCLLEQCSIRYVTSGRDLVRGQNNNKTGTNKLGTTAPAIVVNPDYDLAGAAAKTAIKAVLPEFQIDENATRGETSRSSLPRVSALPFTSLEGTAAKPSLEQLAKSEPVFYEQDKALEAVVKKFQRPKHLLLSTHGFFLPDQEVKRDDKQDLLVSNDSQRTRSVALTTEGKPVENPLLRCGLLLAGCNAPREAGLDDGILTGMEIVGMDLRGTELVVLSACETGIGKVRNGEGVAGLRQAFQLAGAQSVVSTLWQVPDRDSALIMQDFFTNLAAGQTKADALRNAQLKRIAARKEKSGAAHPFFWAAWTVTGE